MFASFICLYLAGFWPTNSVRQEPPSPFTISRIAGSPLYIVLGETSLLCKAGYVCRALRIFPNSTFYHLSAGSGWLRRLDFHDAPASIGLVLLALFGLRYSGLIICYDIFLLYFFGCNMD